LTGGGPNWSGFTLSATKFSLSRFISGLWFRTMTRFASALSLSILRSVARHKGVSRDAIIATL
jgi:hypothetical protein